MKDYQKQLEEQFFASEGEEIRSSFEQWWGFCSRFPSSIEYDLDDLLTAVYAYVVCGRILLEHWKFLKEWFPRLARQTVEYDENIKKNHPESYLGYIGDDDEEL